MKISILVPAYMEEATIGAILERIDALDLSAMGVEKEVIVCDDGSTDGTAEVVSKFEPKSFKVILVRHPVNRGKGAAIRTALTEATGDVCIVQDADLEYDVEDYPSLIEPFVDGKADVVFGSRFLKRAHPTGMRMANFLANKILTVAANRLFGHHITDEATCFKVFRTPILKDMNLQCTGFEFCPEVVSKLGVRHIDVFEVPIEYRARDVESGKKVRWTDGVEAISVMLKIKSADLLSKVLSPRLLTRLSALRRPGRRKDD